MTIKEIINANIYDENEQVVIMEGDVNDPTRVYTGILNEIPEDYLNTVVEQVSSMSENRRAGWNLNKYGWTEIWIG